ncbi:MAG: hypothetical protein JW760_05660 [Spirochaetales bacterium]|nr:hypothetical protein [Spirochaetales bacterium]
MMKGFDLSLRTGGFKHSHEVHMKRFIWCMFIIVLGTAGTMKSYAQEETDVLHEEVGEEAPDTRLIPVFPPETEGLIFIEGEDAVSTNFTKDPVYNYGCSNLKTLQLSRSTGLQGGVPFYAQYVFYVENPGVYTFGYGGTPPGPAEDLYPSYVSPFSYTLDDGPERTVYREDVAVIDSYTPMYYWVHLGEVELSAGIHTITFRVSEKRGYDSLYFFYLDHFFFMESSRQDEILKNPGRELFPTDYNDRSMDTPFLSVADYTKIIEGDPDNGLSYIQLSLVYSLLGDYLSALKTLQKASALNPEDPYPLLLTAKNRIWKGDIAEGIEVYRQVLRLDPDNRAYWDEAAKVAAWTDLSQEALDLYKKGLEEFPEDLSLTVNLALTYLWLSRNDEAEEYFRKARDTAEKDPLLFFELGRVFARSGYDARAAEVYEEAIQNFPEFLEPYLLLEAALNRLGRNEEAALIQDRITRTFQPSEELTANLELFREKNGMKAALLKDYREQVEQNPADLTLRSFLVQTYFWNGMRREAVEEMQNILAGYAYNVFVSLDTRSFDLYESLETLNIYIPWFDVAAGEAAQRKTALREGLSSYLAAEKEAAKEAESEESTGTAARDLFRGQEESFNSLLEETRFFLENWKTGLEFYSKDADIQQLIEKEQEDKKAFELLTKAVRWSWDRKFHLGELEQTFQREPVLAGYTLGRLYHFEGNYPLALSYLDNPEVLESTLGPVTFAHYQARAWSSPSTELPLWEEASYELTSYADYLTALHALPDRLSERRAVDYLYPEDPKAEAELFLTKLSALEAEVPARKKEVLDKQKILKRIALERMKRAFYQLEEQTYLLRYELGDYYLVIDSPEPAVEQFKRVLSIDPWNISATYKLGTVQQLSGNWSKAMDSYLRVYWNDAGYANAVRYYNQLAREHADGFSFSSTAFYDTSRLNYSSKAAYRRLVNSFLGWDLSYIYRNDRLYRPSGVEEPGAYSLHSLEMALPLSFFHQSLTVRPFAGLGIYNNLYAYDPEFPPGASRQPEVLFTEFRNDLFYGVEGIYKAAPMEVKGLWQYNRKPDTYLPGRQEVFNNSGEATVSVYLPFPEDPKVNAVSTRTYGKLEFLSDSNFIGTVVQEVVGSFHLADTPWINLDILAVGSYEDSKIPDTIYYYSPQTVVVLKGGVRGSASVSLEKGSLGVQAYLAAGGYRAAGDEEGMSFQADGSVDLGYYRGNSALTLSLYGGGTFTRGAFPLTDYWFFQGSLAFTTKMPELLAE